MSRSEAHAAIRSALQANLAAQLIGAAGFIGVALWQEATTAVVIYLFTIFTAFLPAPLPHLGKILVAGTFAACLIAGAWGAAAVLAALTIMRYTISYLALRRHAETEVS